jgi:hypothetical protein
VSYSITAAGADKGAARLAIEAKFDSDVVARQPVHSRDRQAVLANVDSVLALLADERPPGPYPLEVRISVNGYMSWSGSIETATLHAVSVSATASWAQVIPPRG